MKQKEKTLIGESGYEQDKEEGEMDDEVDEEQETKSEYLDHQQEENIRDLIA